MPRLIEESDRVAKRRPEILDHILRRTSRPSLVLGEGPRGHPDLLCEIALREPARLARKREHVVIEHRADRLEETRGLCAEECALLRHVVPARLPRLLLGSRNDPGAPGDAPLLDRAGYLRADVL